MRKNYCTRISSGRGDNDREGKKETKKKKKRNRPCVFAQTDQTRLDGPGCVLYCNDLGFITKLTSDAASKKKVMVTMTVEIGTDRRG